MALARIVLLSLLVCLVLGGSSGFKRSSSSFSSSFSSSGSSFSGGSHFSSSTCGDKVDSCTLLVKHDKCGLDWVKEVCMGSCGFCGSNWKRYSSSSSSSTITVTEGSSSSSSSCKDKFKSCDLLSKKDRCNMPWILEACPSSCGRCETRTTTTTTVSSTGCGDKVDSCDLLVKHKKCGVDWVKEVCMGSCGFCGSSWHKDSSSSSSSSSSSTVIIRGSSSTSTSSSGCHDKFKSCDILSKKDRCNMPWIHEACPSSCGRCDTNTDVTTSCGDKIDSCRLLVKHNKCGLQWVKDSCMGSCGFCGGSSTTTTVITETETETETVTEVEKGCVDRFKSCKLLAKNLKCGKIWVQETCGFSCKVCTGEEPIPTPPQPTPAPTDQPTPAPTAQPTLAPTAQPTLAPTAQPTLAPTAQPTLAPTAQPTLAPTAQPTSLPTAQPTLSPTAQPTSSPTATPFETPSEEPPARSPPTPECRDDFSECAAWAEEGECEVVKHNPKSFLMEHCKASCNVCETVKDVSPPKPVCEDNLRLKTCQLLRKNKKCGVDWVKQSCQSTCGLCPGQTPVIVQDEGCEDNMEECPFLAEHGLCGLEAEVDQNCQFSCKTCKKSHGVTWHSAVEIAHPEWKRGGNDWRSVNKNWNQNFGAGLNGGWSHTNFGGFSSSSTSSSSSRSSSSFRSSSSSSGSGSSFSSSSFSKSTHGPKPGHW